MVGTYASQAMAAVLVAALGLMLAGCSAPPPVPTSSPVDNGLSLSPASNSVYECLTERGWTVKLNWDGGIEVSSEDIPEAQVDLYRADSDECWAMVDDRIAAMDTDEIVAVYQAELGTRECLIALGYEVGDQPSEQSYIDDFFGSRWSAYGDSDVMSAMSDEAEWRTVNETCPQPAWSLGAGT